MTDRTGRTRAYRFKGEWRGTTRTTLLRRSGGRCEGCGNPGSDGKGKGLTKAHIIDKALGGSDDPGNLLLLCASCHGRFDAGKRQAAKAS